jgi:hypothetical protein
MREEIASQTSQEASPPTRQQDPEDEPMTAQSNATYRMLSRGRLALIATVALATWLLPAAAAQAAPPAWSLSVEVIGGDGGVYFSPGAHGTAANGPGYVITATNTGHSPTNSDYKIVDTLPTGLSGAVGQISAEDENGNALTCSGTAVVTCSGTVPVGVGEKVTMTLPVNVAENASGTVTNEPLVEGGGAGHPASASVETYLSVGRPALDASYLAAYPTNLVPSSSPWATYNEFYLDVTNVGGAPTSGQITFTSTFSAGITPTHARLNSGEFGTAGTCDLGSPTPQQVTCTMDKRIRVSELMVLEIGVDTGTLPEGETVTDEVTLTGGSSPNAQASTSSMIAVNEEFAPFGYLPGNNGLSATLTGEDGLPATQAGSHPGVFAVQLGFPVRTANLAFGTGNFTADDGGVRDARTYLPPGVIVNPQATEELCPEAQNEQDSCPNGTAVGTADLQSNLGFGFSTFQSPLFNLIAPPGRPAAFSFDAAGVGIYPHILGGIREGGNYAIASVANDVIELFPNPFLGLRLEFWDDPSNPSHDYNRGGCLWNGGGSGCEIPQQEKPLITMPTSCSGSMLLDANIDSWGHPGQFIHSNGPVVDANGNPTSVTGCNALEFEPSLKARPTTTVADSPSGLEFDLKITQNESFNTLAAAHLRKAVVTLPEGLVINPSGANGLRGCTSAEIGIDNETGIPDGNPPTCPEAARLGTAEIDTTLLDHPMPGSIYLAEPFDNQFHSMLAIYVVVNDARSGTLIKLAGKIEANPQTGQLTTTFDENPQLPFTDFKLNFFGGALAPLRTPATCGEYETSSSITPWSAPESGPPATPNDEYEVTQSPGTQNCPHGANEEAHSPTFDAGTIAPVAGTYSPLVVNLRRADGSQQFSSFTVTPPPGLLGKLAGIPYCADSALAAAAAKTGREELASPSCPAASKVGTVTVGAGAGPAPYYVQGSAYLTGPYKGAPLGLAVVTPAVAGAYDLGTVVVRAALHINPANAQITGVSDSLPTILKGIPLDIRSVQLRLDRPNFTLNPTSCNAMQFTGSLVSTLGQAAPLLSRFQLGECVNLGFKPSLSLRLKGGTKRTANPALIADLKAREGDANIAKARVKLPPTALLDNGHIGDVCSRVQFSAETCPADSVYGKAEATSPLLDYTASGPVYLRANPEHELPDLVAALKGPASQPIEVDLAGTTDSVKGALRNTFEAVPDVPVSTFHLELFGASKSLIELSRNICAKHYRATVEMEAQNGKTFDSSPVVANSCKHKPRHRRHHHRAH